MSQGKGQEWRRRQRDAGGAYLLEKKNYINIKNSEKEKEKDEVASRVQGRDGQGEHNSYHFRQKRDETNESWGNRSVSGKKFHQNNKKNKQIILTTLKRVREKQKPHVGDLSSILKWGQETSDPILPLLTTFLFSPPFCDFHNGSILNARLYNINN